MSMYFSKKLATIPENKQLDMSHPFQLQSKNWAMVVQNNNSLKPYNRLDFKPKIANWFNENIPEYQNISIHEHRCSCDVYNFPHNEELHYEEDTSFFPDINGNIVRFNRDDDLQIIDDIECCSKCNSIQEDNILLTCCSNQHFLCTECYTEEKNQCFRQNAEYEREKRNPQKIQKIQPYKYICPICDTFNRLNFNIYYGEDINDEIVIIQVYKQN